MQLRPVMAHLPEPLQERYAMVAGIVLVTVILTRIAWVMFFNTLLRAQIAHYGFHPRRPMMRPTVQGGVVISWCGMRGIVTLAAAFALPEDFPYRDLILLTAFVVVLGTLLIQGVTLAPLIKLLDLDVADPVAVEVTRARGDAYRAALAAIDGDDSAAAKLLREEYQTLLDNSRHGDGGVDGELPADPLRRKAINAARQAILLLRASGEIGDDAFHRIEQELDLAELNAGAG